MAKPQNYFDLKRIAEFYDRELYDSQCKIECPNTNSFRTLLIMAICFLSAYRIGETYRSDINNRFLIITGTVLIVISIVSVIVVYFNYVYAEKYFLFVQKKMNDYVDLHFVHYLEHVESGENARAAAKNYQEFLRWIFPISKFNYGDEVNLSVYRSFVLCDDLSTFDLDTAVKEARGW